MSLQREFPFRKLRIGHRKFALHFFGPKEDSKHNGYVKFDEAILGINRDLAIEEAARVLVHELHHAIVEDRVDLSDLLPKKYRKSAGKIEERMVDALSRGFCQVLVENPKLYAFLRKAML